MADIIREELVELSVMRCITTGLPSFGYTLTQDPTVPDGVYVRPAFPTATERAEELTITTLAFGFNIDDGGEPAEMGSTLTKYVHTLTCWVFAMEPNFGYRLGHTIKHIVRQSGNAGDAIPIYDFNVQPDSPQIDTDIVMKVQTRHEVNNSPRPWDRFVWTTSIAVQDIAYL
jgi:hypothetical protein